MSEHEHWQLDGSAPELYERYLVPAITLIWASDLIDRVRPAQGERVLDIACGTGKDIASNTELLLDADMLRDGRLSFPQEAFVATASRIT